MKKLSLSALCLAVALLAVSCSSEPKTLDELRSAGQREFNDAHWSAARAYFQKALGRAPSDKQLLYLTGLCYKRESIYDSAVVILKKADYLYPRDREINLALREVAELDGKWGYAIGAISVLVGTGDKIENWYADLARLSARNNEPIISMYYQRRLQKINHEDLLEWTRLINVSLMVDSLDIARIYLDSAVVKFGMSDELLESKGKLEGSLGHMAEAEKIFRTLYAKNPNVSANKYNLANLLSSANDKTSKMEAIELLRLIPEGERKIYRADSLIILIQKQIDKL